MTMLHSSRFRAARFPARVTWTCTKCPKCASGEKVAVAGEKKVGNVSSVCVPRDIDEHRRVVGKPASNLRLDEDEARARHRGFFSPDHLTPSQRPISIKFRSETTASLLGRWKRQLLNGRVVSSPSLSILSLSSHSLVGLNKLPENLASLCLISTARPAIDSLAQCALKFYTPLKYFQVEMHFTFSSRFLRNGGQCC